VDAVTRPDKWLRWGGWTATGFGLTTLVAAGLLAPLLAVGTLVLAVGAGVASGRDHSPAQAQALRLAGLGMAGLVLAGALGRGLATNGLGDLGAALAVALSALIVGQALAQRTRHDRLVALLLAGLGPVLAAGLAPSPRVMVPALACWLAISATLAASHLLPAETAPPVAAGPTSAGSTSARPTPAEPFVQLNWVAPVAAVVAASTALGVVMFLLVPRPQGLAVLSPDRGEPSTPARAVDNYSGQQSMDLRSQGSLPNDALFLVPSEGPTLWRSTVLTAYDNGVWGAWSEGDGSSLGSGQVSVPGSLVDVGTPTRPTRTDEVTVLPQAVADFPAPAVIAPGRVVSVRTDQSVIRQSGGGLALQPTDSDRFSYDVTSVVQPQVATAVPKPGSSWTEPDPQVWLQLPWDLPQRVVDLGHQLVDPAPTRAAAVAAVEDYLRSHEQYELNAPVASAQQDPVDYFLFVSHLGFCEHFASAEAVLLRAAGVPARVVTGFAAAAVPGDQLGDGRQLIRANEAHAWVEVWIPGVGWATSDPTAGVTPANPALDPFGAAGRWLQAVLARPAQRLGLALVILVAAALVVGLVRWLAGRRRRAPAQGPTSSRARVVEPFAAFARLEHRLAAVGLPRRSNETPTELLDRLPDDARRPLEVVEQASYAASAPDPADVAAASAALDDLVVGQRRC
jgi:protein-glutamine gamma-glutamyltransferase